MVCLTRLAPADLELSLKCGLSPGRRLEVTALLATPSAHRRMLRHRFFGKVLMSARIRLDRHNQNPGPRGQKEERGCRGTGLAARFGLLRFK